MLSLEIGSDIFEQMVEYAQEKVPIEACGILAGKAGKVEKLYKMTNIDNSGTHFMMEPREQFGVVKDMRSCGLEMMAIYHSHPETLARPSAEDIRLALTPGVLYIIVSLQEPAKPQIRGFTIKDEVVAESAVTMVAETS